MHPGYTWRIHTTFLPAAILKVPLKGQSVRFFQNFCQFFFELPGGLKMNNMKA